MGFLNHWILMTQHGRQFNSLPSNLRCNNYIELIMSFLSPSQEGGPMNARSTPARSICSSMASALTESGFWGGVPPDLGHGRCGLSAQIELLLRISNRHKSLPNSLQMRCRCFKQNVTADAGTLF